MDQMYIGISVQPPARIEDSKPIPVHQNARDSFTPLCSYFGYLSVASVSDFF
jgi:hypothetical protein